MNENVSIGIFLLYVLGHCVTKGHHGRQQQVTLKAAPVAVGDQSMICPLIGRHKTCFGLPGFDHAFKVAWLLGLTTLYLWGALIASVGCHGKIVGHTLTPQYGLKYKRRTVPSSRQSD